jgi:hypothetical protein
MRLFWVKMFLFIEGAIGEEIGGGNWGQMSERVTVMEVIEVMGVIEDQPLPFFELLEAMTQSPRVQACLRCPGNRAMSWGVWDNIEYRRWRYIYSMEI